MEGFDGIVRENRDLLTALGQSRKAEKSLIRIQRCAVNIEHAERRNGVSGVVIGERDWARLQIE